jgi:hypothetical protein
MFSDHARGSLLVVKVRYVGENPYGELTRDWSSSKVMDCEILFYLSTGF